MKNVLKVGEVSREMKERSDLSSSACQSTSLCQIMYLCHLVPVFIYSDNSPVLLS